jgi:hypothetical protein
VRRSVSVCSLLPLALACSKSGPKPPAGPPAPVVNEQKTHDSTLPEQVWAAVTPTQYRTTDTLMDLDVRSIAVAASGVYAGAPSGLFVLSAAGDRFLQAAGFDPTPVVDLAVDDHRRLLVAHPSSVEVEGGMRTPLTVRVLSIAGAGGKLFAGTDHGVIEISGGATSTLASGFLARDLVATSAALFAATSSGVVRIDLMTGAQTTLNKASGLPDDDVRALSISQDGTQLHAACKSGFGALDASGKILTKTMPGIGGLPNPDLLAIAERGGEVLTGHQIGATVSSTSGVLHYHSLRWLPAERVTAVAFGDDGARWIATASAGISRIHSSTISFSDKAALFDGFLEQRHWRMDGFVDDSPSFDDPYNLTNPHHGDNDNDGLWTEMQIGAWCLAYGATHDEQYYDKAHKALQVMFLEFDVPGATFAAKGLSQGFITRSLVREDEGAIYTEKAPMSNWHAQAFGGNNYYWKGDTSSDEYTGHFFGLPLYYDLCAKDDAERGEIRKRAASAIDYLIANNYWLIDITGMPTTFGRWRDLAIAVDGIDGCPAKHDNNLALCLASWGGGGWLNATEILGYLLATYHMTGDPKYYAEYERLHTDQEYGKLIPLTDHTFTVTDPSLANHSDHELATLAYFTLLRYEPNPDRRAIWIKSILDFWSHEKPERNPFELAVIMSAQASDVGLADSIQTLKDLPVDWRSWLYNNIHRVDAKLIGPDRGGSAQFDRVFPYGEIRTMKWNGNPYEVSSGGNGSVVQAPTPWLLPYWMMRYYGVIH